jgi:anti-sigma regulatory factor (Ser/Thr protein kinase)
VCNKGIPSALMMAAARSVLRQCAREFVTPDRVLKTANDLLFPDTPRHMFTTCFYGVLNPATGSLQYANAGHTLPYRLHQAGIEELRATGMPLGLMTGMEYEVKETVIHPDERLLLISDGLSEARDALRDMAGTQRVLDWAGNSSGEACIEGVLAGLREFTGPDWEQEDDITVVVVDRVAAQVPAQTVNSPKNRRLIVEFELESQPGNERLAAEMVIESLQAFNFTNQQRDRMHTAVAETVLNAMEHGNLYHEDQPAFIQVYATSSEIRIRVVDTGGSRPIPPETHPNLQAKLNGTQSPRGWGLFLIRNMVDEMVITSDENSHSVELVFSLKGVPHGS